MQRGQDDVEIAIAQHLGGRIREAVRRDVLNKFVYHLEADLFVRLLAALKAQFDPDFEIVAEELDGVVALHGQIVRVNRRGKLQLFHPTGRLRGADVFAALGFFVKEFAVIDDPANRGYGVGSDLDQVKALVLRQTQGRIQGHDAELLLGFVEDPDFARADFAVPAVQWFARLE